MPYLAGRLSQDLTGGAEKVMELIMGDLSNLGCGVGSFVSVSLLQNPNRGYLEIHEFLRHRSWWARTFRSCGNVSAAK